MGQRSGCTIHSARRRLQTVPACIGPINMRNTPRALAAAGSVLCLLAFAPLANSYSVLTHEAVIDTLWEPSIKPLLLKRYPTASKEQLLEAHAYVYGGCIIQDMGYYPLGS